ncbi:MAG: hypothetical protein AAGB19_14425 [Cyanobacteria bacterium P01_F01_bin.3]
MSNQHERTVELLLATINTTLQNIAMSLVHVVPDEHKIATAKSVRDAQEITARIMEDRDLVSRKGDDE